MLLHHKIVNLLTICLLLTSAFSTNAEARKPIPSLTREQQDKIAETVKAQLSQAKTAADSVPLLFNLFDLNSTALAYDIAIQLAETARRAGKNDIALEAMMNAANSASTKDSLVNVVLQRVEKEFPQSPQKKSARTFINMVYNTSVARYADEEHRSKLLQELLRKLASDPPSDVYDKIVITHAICVNLARISEGELLVEYVRKLGDLIDQLPADDHSIRNAYYVWSSMMYTRAGNNDEAIEACKSLLDEMLALDERNRKIGRKYRSYDAYRYTTYTRLLENYQAMSPADVERYYMLAKEMVQRDPIAKMTYGKAPLPDIYYNFYKANYRKAFELIDRCKDDKYLKPRQLQILGMYISAANAIGEKEALLEVYPIYNKLLKDELESRQNERTRELEVVYEVNDIHNENLRLQQDRNAAQRHLWKTVTIVSIALVLILTAFIIILLHLNRRRLRLAQRLKDSNRALRNESKSLAEARDQLRAARDEAQKADELKTEFINNMSHEVKAPLQAITEYSQMIIDNIDEEHKKFLDTFASRLTVNCELVNTIVNDVLQLTELHNSSLKIKENLYDIKPICDTAIDSVRHHFKPGVKILFTPDSENFLMRTDRHRVLQILVNILSNAAKFTREGAVTISIRKSADGTKAIISVADTGCGIAPENAESIFNRFTKLDSSVSGAGLGLTIARMLAQRLGGSLVLDTDYTDGARFVLTLPMKLAIKPTIISAARA